MGVGCALPAQTFSTFSQRSHGQGGVRDGLGPCWNQPQLSLMKKCCNDLVGLWRPLNGASIHEGLPLCVPLGLWRLCTPS